VSSAVTVLITGAGGFIGRHLVEAQLQLGRRVIAVDVNVEPIADLGDTDGLQIAEVDIRAGADMAQLMRGVDVVFNLAAAHLEVGVDDEHFQAVNVAALRSLLQSADDLGVRRFIHCSSVGVYGPLNELPADEETPCSPDITYERTKLQGEEVIRDFAVSGDMRSLIIRPSWVYGRRCPRTLKLIRTVARKRFFYVGDGSNYRHPLYIDDLMRAFELATNCRLSNAETLLIVGPAPVTVRELVEAIMEELQVQYRPIRLPEPLVALGCGIIEKVFVILNREPPFSSRSLKFFTENSAFAADKARRELGFEARTDLASGLSYIIADSRRQRLV